MIEPETQHILIHEAGSGVFRGGFHPVRDLWNYRFALHSMILKDFRIRYRNMSLGFLWSILNPLVMLGVLVFVFSYVYPQRNAQYFPVFLLLGIITFNFFSLCVSMSTGCIVENPTLIKKVIFPRFLLPISVVLSQGIHLLIQLLLAGVFVIVFKVPVTPYFLWIPAIFLVELIFIVGVALLTSSLNAFYRDMQYLVQSGLSVLFWFTPVFYSLDQARQNLPPWLYRLFILNPLAGCIDAARRAVLERSHPDFTLMGIALAVGVAFFFAGSVVFMRLERAFTDKI